MKYFIWFVIIGIFLYWIIPFHSQETLAPPQSISHAGITRWNDTTYSTYYYEPEQPLFIRYTYINNELEGIDVRILPKNTAHLIGSVNQKLSHSLQNDCMIRSEEFFQNTHLIHIPIKH